MALALALVVEMLPRRVHGLGYTWAHHKECHLVEKCVFDVGATHRNEHGEVTMSQPKEHCSGNTCFQHVFPQHRKQLFSVHRMRAQHSTLRSSQAAGNRHGPSIDGGRQLRVAARCKIIFRRGGGEAENSLPARMNVHYVQLEGTLSHTTAQRRHKLR